jgi:SAM-dependent methyltransferase
MGTETWIPDSTPLDMPSAARIYDYMLGGYHNFEVDRLVGEKLLEIHPDARLAAQACRAFLRRVVNFLVEQGIDQFLDIGSGIPTVGNVHQIAQEANPAARVVYVDIDRVAVAHSQAMLEDNPNATAIWGDANYPEQILNHAEVRSLLDFSQPAAVLFVTFLHYITDDDQALNTVRAFRDALAPGSYIAISHGTPDNAPPGTTEGAEKLSATTPTPSKYRPRPEILKFFDGLELVEPGLVYIPLWHPEGPDDPFLDRPEEVLNWGGVGRKAK